jgi:hypothetical protein
MGLIKLPENTPPFIAHINNRLDILNKKNPFLFPDFSNAGSVFSVSDYSGENKEGYYQALSFLIVDWNNAGLWEAARRALRSFKLDYERNFEYKKLNKDKERRRLLNEFLHITETLEGLTLTYLIDKKIRYLFTERSPHTILFNSGFGDWKPHIAEKILRIIHLQAPIIYFLTNENHKFLWLTDRDAITKDVKALGNIFQSIFNLYATHKFQSFGYAQPFKDKNKSIDDLLSVPDLVAASILEFHNRQKDMAFEEKENFEIQEKANEILIWLSEKNTPLKKLVCIIDKQDEALSISFREFNPSKNQ